MTEHERETESLELDRLAGTGTEADYPPCGACGEPLNPGAKWCEVCQFIISAEFRRVNAGVPA